MPTDTAEAPMLVKIDDVIRLTGFNRKTVHNYVAQGLLPQPVIPATQGRSAVWNRAQVMAVLNGEQPPKK